MAFSPQLQKHNQEIVRRHHLEFPVLRDEGNALAREFGLVFELAKELQPLYLKMGVSLPEYNGDPSWTLPMPARFIVAQDATIVYAESDPDYTVRPEPEETLNRLKELVGA